MEIHSERSCDVENDLETHRALAALQLSYDTPIDPYDVGEGLLGYGELAPTVANELAEVGCRGDLHGTDR
jgi:hypothetical protein